MNVLFIDDEQMLRTLGERILKKAGYDVVTTESGQEGLDAFSADPDSFDLVIIDQSMHGLTGIETMQKLRKLNPEIPYIISSGHQLDDQNLPSELQNNMKFLGKPYRSNQLVEVVEEVLSVRAQED